MDIVILCILMFTLVVVSLILAIALAVITKRYVNLKIEYKQISGINIDNDFVTIYGKCEGGSGGSGTDEPSPVILTRPNQNIESEREIDSYDAIIDEEKYKYDICLDLRNHGTGSARIVTEEGFESDTVIDVYEDGNDVLFVLLKGNNPSFKEIEFLISKYLDRCEKNYKNIYLYSDYDFRMYNRTSPAHYDQMLYNTFKIDSVELVEGLKDGYCLCRICIIRECELIEGAMIHSYSQNVTKVLHEGEMEE